MSPEPSSVREKVASLGLEFEELYKPAQQAHTHTRIHIHTPPYTHIIFSSVPISCLIPFHHHNELLRHQT